MIYAYLLLVFADGLLKDAATVVRANVLNVLNRLTGALDNAYGGTIYVAGVRDRRPRGAGSHRRARTRMPS